MDCRPSRAEPALLTVGYQESIQLECWGKEVKVPCGILRVGERREEGGCA